MDVCAIVRKSLNVLDIEVHSIVSIPRVLQVIAITAPSHCGANATVANETWGHAWPIAKGDDSRAVFTFGTPAIGVRPAPPNSAKARIQPLPAGLKLDRKAGTP